MSQPNDLIIKLSQQGYRMTPQRMMILAAIEDSHDHISADEVYAEVVAKYPHVNISTIYRTLELLKELGLVTETDLGGGRVRYHPVDKGHHHHLVCHNCAKVIDLNEDLLIPLKAVLLQDYHFNANLKHLAIFGYCSDCHDSQTKVTKERI